MGRLVLPRSNRRPVPRVFHPFVSHVGGMLEVVVSPCLLVSMTRRAIPVLKPFPSGWTSHGLGLACWVAWAQRKPDHAHGTGCTRLADWSCNCTGSSCDGLPAVRGAFVEGL
jgi:hypothetical protein